MSTENIIIILVAAVLLVFILSRLLGGSKRRSQKLREKFGPEYDYTLEKVGDQKAAEETLQEREKRVTNFNLRALDQNERDRYQAEWTKIQTDFVDQPSTSVQEANRLMSEAMVTLGFPVTDFDKCAAALSVF